MKSLSEAIEARGWSTWVDRANIPSASDWMAEIRLGIESADGFVFVLTPSSIASRMCRVELSIAVDLSKRLLPLWGLEKAAWEAAEKRLRERGGSEIIHEIPPELRKLDYIDINDFSDSDDPFVALVDDLIKAASRDLAWLRRHTRLQQDVKRWIEGRYVSAALIRGPLLCAAEEMLSAVDKDPPLTELQREFVEASRAEDRRILEREAEQLAHRILDLPDERIALGVMLALEGLETYLHIPQLEGALRTLMSRWPQRAIICHKGFATAAMFSRDGARVLTSSADGFLRLVDARNGVIISQMGQSEVPIWCAALFPDSKTAAAACADGLVRVINLETGQSREFRVSQNDVNSLILSSDGHTLIAVSGSIAIVIELLLDRQYELPHHPGSIKSVALPDDRRLVTTCEGGKVRVFHLDTQQWEEFSLPDQAINSAQMSSDGTWMVVGGSFSDALVLETVTRTVKRKLEVPGGSALSVVISADEKRVAVNDIWGSVLIFDLHSGELMSKKRLFPRYAWGVSMNHDGSLFCGVSDTGLALVSETASGHELLCAGHDGPVRAAEFDSRGELLVTVGSDSTVRIFGIGQVPGKLTLPHSNTVINADLSPDGALVVTTARDGITRTFDVQTGVLLSEYARPQSTLLSATFRSAEELVVAFKEGHIAFVSARSGAEFQSLESVPLKVNSEVRMTSDRRWLVAQLFQEIERVIDPEDGSVVDVDEQDLGRIVSDIHQQSGLVSSGGQIKEDDAGQTPLLEREGKAIYLKTAEYQVIHARLAPDGLVVVGAALNRNELPIFDGSNGELIATLWLGHQSNSARFSPDGAHIVATWLNAVSVVRYLGTASLLGLARGQIYRQLSEEERAEFGLPKKNDTQAEN